MYLQLFKRSCNWDQPIFHIRSNIFNHSFACPIFLWRGSWGQQPWEDWKYLTVNSNIWYFCWRHTKTGPRKVRVVVTPPDPGRPLGRFPVGAASRTCLANLSWDILDTWPNQHSWDLSNRTRCCSALRASRISQLLTLSRSGHTVKSC